MKSSVFISSVFYCLLNYSFNQTNCNIIRRHRPSEIDSIHNFDLIMEKLDASLSYIVRGDFVKIEEYPWIVSLTYNHDHICGGTIVSSTRVVTAAHCTTEGISNRFQIRAGSSALHGDAVVVGVYKIVNHPHFDRDTAENDISILFLASELKTSPKIGIIGLPKQDQHISEGSNLKVAGWGSTSWTGGSTEFLLAITIPSLRHDHCVKMYQWINDVTDSMICAGVEGGKKSPCYGDSGGPLTYGKMLIGVVSWGDRCGGKSAVFTRVASFTDWINSHL